VDSVDEIDIDAELDEWLVKEAAASGIDLGDQRRQELEIWERWRENPNPEDFELLYNSQQNLLNRGAGGYVRNTNLPPAAVKARILRNYVKALETFDPSKRQLHSHVMASAGYRIPRYINDYTNVAKIPEQRAGLIHNLQNSLAHLEDLLGRPPSDTELADEMLISAEDQSELRRDKITPKEVGTLRKELRRALLAEDAGGESVYGTASQYSRQAVFLHGSLNPQQQLVLEHAYEGFGKPIITDPMDLAKVYPDLSPQKIRAIQKQIRRKVEGYTKK
jgi:hypothetical protein